MPSLPATLLKPAVTVLITLVALCPAPDQAQASQAVLHLHPRPALNPSAIQGSLGRLVAQAPVIFSGTVLAAPPAGPDEPVAANLRTLRIQVEHSVRGLPGDPVFALRQWQGAAGAVLNPGDRVLLFLHQPNAAGLTSPVLGSLGILHIGGGRLIDLRPLASLIRQAGLFAEAIPSATGEAAMQEPRPIGLPEARCSPVPVAPHRPTLEGARFANVDLQCGSTFGRGDATITTLPEVEVLEIVERLIAGQQANVVAFAEQANVR